MYEPFYGLNEGPFSLLPDPAYLFLSRQHKMALTLLKYGLINHHSYTVITGEVGAGKTTLINKLLTEIREDFTVGLINFTDKRVTQLMPWVLRAYKLPYENMSTVKMHDCFTEFLVEERENGRMTVLIVDEAQNLAHKVLENLRLLSNVNANDTYLQLILIGQPEFRKTLEKPKFRQLTQRVSTYYRLDPLSQAETEHYIKHRIGIAGGNPKIFSSSAINKIWKQTGGIPRSINTLCDLSLVYGFANSRQVIDEKLVEEMLADRQEFAVVPSSLHPTQNCASSDEGKQRSERSLFERLAETQQSRRGATAR